MSSAATKRADTIKGHGEQDGGAGCDELLADACDSSQTMTPHAAIGTKGPPGTLNGVPPARTSRRFNSRAAAQHTR